MATYKKLGILLLAMLAEIISVEAQGSWVSIGSNPVETDYIRQQSRPVRLNFRQGSSLLVRDFMSNADELDYMGMIMGDAAIMRSLDSITIVAYASPEGSVENNFRLADERAAAVKTYIMWKFPRTDRNRILVQSRLIDWPELERLVNSDSRTPNRYEVLSLIRSNLWEVDKVAKLRTIGSGAAFRYIVNHFGSALRTATTIAFWSYGKQMEVQLVTDWQYSANGSAGSAGSTGSTGSYTGSTGSTGSQAGSANIQTAGQLGSTGSWTNGSTGSTGSQAGSTIIKTDTIYIDRYVDRYIMAGDSEWTRKPLVAVKTNLLFDAASALNIGLEIPIGRSWSIGAEYIFPWWLWERKQYALETLSANIEVRRWFGNREEKPYLTGWYAGIYAGGGYYDLEWGTKGFQGEFFIAAGLSAGYAHTINKSGTLRMEYSLGVGFLQTKYREYVPMFGVDDQWHLIWQRNGKWSWFGPTTARISLVWMINHGYERRTGR